MLFGMAFFGINAIGAELEDPLGEETNDLPLDVRCPDSQDASTEVPETGVREGGAASIKGHAAGLS